MNYDLYLLTSYPNVINSQIMFLNNNQIIMNNEHNLPQLNGKTIEYGSNITINANTAFLLEVI